MRLLRKIAPLAIAGLFLGATASFAVAADLASWKTNFPGADSAIVLGAAADTTDNIGAINIASVLATSSTGSDTVSGEVEQITSSGDVLSINDSFSAIEGSGFDKDELPIILVDGNYRAHDGGDFKFMQKINFGTSYPLATFKKDSDSPVSTEPTLMVYGLQDTAFVNYTLIFNEYAKSTNTSGTLDDFESSQIKILGETYDIINAEISGTKITLDLMTGAVKATLQEDEEATYTIGGKTYTVKLNIVDSSGQAKFTVNGVSSDAIASGALFKFEDNIELGVTEVLRQDWAGGKRQATFYLGAEKLSIVDNAYGTYAGTSEGNLKVNDANVQGLYVSVTGSYDGTDVSLQKINFLWMPEDDIFITKDHPVTFPGLGSFKVTFEGLETKFAENIKLNPHGNTFVELNLPFKSGDVSFDVLFTNSTNTSVFQGIGKDASNQLYTVDGTTGTFNESAGHKYLIATDTTDKVSYLIKPNVKLCSDNTACVDLRDEATGEDVVTDAKAGNSYGFGDIDIAITDVNNSATNKSFVYTITNGQGDEVYTKEGMHLQLPRLGTGSWPSLNITGIDSNGVGANTSYVFRFYEENNQTEASMGGARLNFTVGFSSGKTTVSTIDSTTNLVGYDYKDGSEDYYAYSPFGTKVVYSTGGDQDYVTLTYPGEAAEMKAYVAEETASIVSGTTSSGGRVTPVVDTEVDDAIKAMNIIAVGGSAINGVSAEILGLAFPTYGTAQEWVDATAVDGEGKAIIKLMDSPFATGKFALLVAGYSGVDTQRAAKALAEGTPALTGASALLNTATSTVSVITA